MSKASGLPRWGELLNTVLNDNMKKNKDSISYSLSTIDASSAPRVRFVVHRGFVNERRPSEDESWSSNPPTPICETMLVTTDVRGPKSAQIQANKSIELAWWFAETQHQFRIRANAWILPKAGHPVAEQFPGAKLAPKGLDNFDWESERVRIFRKMSPGLRASFCRPIPGTPLNSTSPPIDPASFPESLPTDLEAESDDDKKHIREALENLSLIVLDPYEVDMCLLGEQPNRRQVWSKSEKGDWSEVEVVA